MRPFTPNTVTEPAQIEAELARLGPGDPVTEFGQYRDNVCCAGIAVPDRGQLVGAGHLRPRPGPARALLAELQCAAADLSRAPS